VLGKLVLQLFDLEVLKAYPLNLPVLVYHNYEGTNLCYKYLIFVRVSNVIIEV
jgi:hypothetical protein